MTDKTRQDSGSTHIIRYALELGLLWIDGDGRDKVREALAALDALEAQLEAVGAGGVQALRAAPAGVAPTAPTPQHIVAMERAWLWMDNQADQQSKGGHATFDLMMLREERDALREAIDGSQDTSCEHCHGSGEVLMHTDDCDDELCALNGDQHSCAGKVEDCQCVAPIGASPTPPAEQPQPHYSHLHDADAVHGKRLSVYSKPTAEQQAAPKAAPVVWLSSKQLRGVTALHGQYLPFRCQPEGRFDTPVYLVEAAPKTAPKKEAQEPCQTCAALARTVMCDQVSFDRKPDCYGIRQITDDEAVEAWEDIRTSPDVAREEANDMMATGRGEIYEVVPLWTTPQHAPQPAPAPLSEQDEEAAMYRWLRAQHEDDSGELRCCVYAPNDMRECLVPVGDMPGELDAFIRAALATQKGNP